MFNSGVQLVRTLVFHNSGVLVASSLTTMSAKATLGMIFVPFSRFLVHYISSLRICWP